MRVQGYASTAWALNVKGCLTHVPVTFSARSTCLQITSSPCNCQCFFQALNETAREDAEWILWMDLDTVAVQSDIAFPLEDYEGKDVVLWIQPELVLQGDAFRTSSSPANAP